MFIKKINAPWLMFTTDPEEGGSAAEPAEPAAEMPDGDAPEGGDAPLGEAGERALEAMKKKERETRAKLRAANERIAALEAPKEGEQTPEQIRAEIEREAAQKFQQRIVAAEVKAAAAARFADPEDAIAFVRLGDFEVSEDGAVDPADIEDALTDLLARKPHLAKQDAAQGGSKKRVPEVHADPAGGKHEPVTLDEQIAAAHKAGDWRKVMHLQNQKLVGSN